MTFKRWNFLLVAFFIVAVLFHWNIRIQTGEAYPRGTFLFSPWDRYKDLINLLPHVRDMDPYRWNGSVYFPFAYVLLIPFSWFRDLQATVLFFMVSIAGLFWTLHRFEVPKVGWLGLILFSYPVWFALDRANPEIFVFLFLAAFLNGFLSKSRLAPVWLAFAIALKAYPAVFLVLLLKHKKWADVFWSASLAVLLSLASGAFFEGGLKATHVQLLSNLKFHHGMYILGDLCTRFNLGAFGWIKLHWIQNDPDLSLWFLERYIGIALAVFTIAAGRILFSRTREIEIDVLILALSMIVLPELSYDYKLLHLYLPILVYFGRRRFLDSQNVGYVWSDRGLPNWVWVIFPVLIPFQYWILKDEVGAGSLLRPPVLLMTYIGLILSYRSSFWRGRYYRESQIPVRRQTP